MIREIKNLKVSSGIERTFSLKNISEHNLKTLIEYTFINERVLNNYNKKILNLKIENIKNTKKRFIKENSILKNQFSKENLIISQKDLNNALKLKEFIKDYSIENALYYLKNGAFELKQFYILQFQNNKENYFDVMKTYFKSLIKELNENKLSLMNDLNALENQDFKINLYDLKLLEKGFYSENVKKVIYFNLRELKAHKQNKKINILESQFKDLFNKTQSLNDLKKGLIKKYTSKFNQDIYSLNLNENLIKINLTNLKSFIENFNLSLN